MSASVTEVKTASSPKRPQPVLVYLAILATVWAVASITLGIMIYQNGSKLIHQNVVLYNQTKDINDNLCNQSAYSGGTTCAGG